VHQQILYFFPRKTIDFSSKIRPITTLFKKTSFFFSCSELLYWEKKTRLEKMPCFEINVHLLVLPTASICKTIDFSSKIHHITTLFKKTYFLFSYSELLYWEKKIRLEEHHVPKLACICWFFRLPQYVKPSTFRQRCVALTLFKKISFLFPHSANYFIGRKKN